MTPHPTPQQNPPQRPDWLKIRYKESQRVAYERLQRTVSDLKLHTVCQEALCPNIRECWGEHQTATFMILGDTCTRACRYCHVHSGRPEGPPDALEPMRVAEAVAALELQHAVITSVDRDDLPDYGAGHFVATIQAVRAKNPGCSVEVLIPDFMGDHQALNSLLAAEPNVLNHNMETVPRLFKRMRSKGQYHRSLKVLESAHLYRQHAQQPMTTKTGLMVGLGETFDELTQVMDDLRAVHCDVLTLGQYLQPTPKHAKIDRYYTLEEFAALKTEALKRGFTHVESGPLVRSSYHAHKHRPE
jgi:lipoic acid synthetase